MKKLLLLVLLLSACGDGGLVQHTVEILGGPEVILQEEPNVEASMKVQNNESNITFRCEAWWNEDGPLDSRATTGLYTKICVAGRCEENSLGPIAELTFWSNDFNMLEGLDNIYCFVTMPEWFTTTGPHGFPDEIFPERTILEIRVPVKTTVHNKTGREYCTQATYDEDGFSCTSWY